MASLHLRHILVEHRHEAEDLQRKLAEGASFEELARKHSRCPSAPQGGDLGAIKLSRLVAEFAEAAEALAPGAISGVVRTRFGHHLIRRES